jgi:hypothetical protein
MMAMGMIRSRIIPSYLNIRILGLQQADLFVGTKELIPIEKALVTPK